MALDRDRNSVSRPDHEPVFDMDATLAEARAHLRLSKNPNAKEHRFARLAVALAGMVEEVERKMHTLAKQLDDANTHFMKLAKQAIDQVESVNRQLEDAQKRNVELARRAVAVEKRLAAAELRARKLQQQLRPR